MRNKKGACTELIFLWIYANFWILVDAEGTKVGCDMQNSIFPSDCIEMQQIRFENWSKDTENVVNKIWAAYPKNSDEISALANWALKRDYKLRPSGGQFSWSPLTIFPNGRSTRKNEGQENRTILVKGQKYLNRIRMGDPTSSNDPSGLPSVSVETGATMTELLQFLEERGLGLASTPGIGHVTVGGVISTGSHGTGTALPNSNQSYSSLSNLIIDLDAIIWDESSRQYTMKNFHRSDPQINPLLTCLGQIFISRVTLRVGQNQNVRCQSYMDFPALDLFINPNSSKVTKNTNTLSSLIEKFGSVSLLHFPFTKHPWLKIYSVSPEKPESSRQVTKPFPYPFTENFPRPVADFFARIQSGNSPLTVKTSRIFATTIRTSLRAFRSQDIWGPSKNILLYVKPSTIPTNVNGFAILTSRSKLQQVLYEMYTIFDSNLEEFRRQGKYPVNTPFEVRISPVEDAADVHIKGAQVPSFSPAAPFTPHVGDSPSKLEFDTCIWLDITSLSKTMYMSDFLRKMETEFYERFNGLYALVRPEWSKRFGYSNDNTQPWTNTTFLNNIPKLYLGWSEAMNLIQKYDPHKVFSNPFFDAIL